MFEEIESSMGRSSVDPMPDRRVGRTGCADLVRRAFARQARRTSEMLSISVELGCSVMSVIHSSSRQRRRGDLLGSDAALGDALERLGVPSSGRHRPTGRPRSSTAVSRESSSTTLSSSTSGSANGRTSTTSTARTAAWRTRLPPNAYARRQPPRSSRPSSVAHQALTDRQQGLKASSTARARAESTKWAMERQA